MGTNGSSWEQIAGGASDIGIGAEGSVWVTGYPNKIDGQNYAIFRRNGNTWSVVDGAGTGVAVSRTDFPG